jgi:hypothetical protein
MGGTISALTSGIKTAQAQAVISTPRIHFQRIICSGAKFIRFIRE